MKYKLAYVLALSFILGITGCGSTDSETATTSNVTETNVKNEEDQEAKKEADKQSGMELLEQNTTVVVDKVLNRSYYYPKTIEVREDAWCPDHTFALPVITIADNKAELLLLVNYIGQEAIFFDNLIFAIDNEERETRTFEYFDVTRETGLNFCDHIAAYMDSNDIELFRKIANSKETVIRYQGSYGSTGVYDLTVTEEDKQTIKTMLDAYELLK